jgi:short-subunit dehydrogenase
MNAKRALVTGASSGLGHVFSKQLAKENFLITCVARSEEK